MKKAIALFLLLSPGLLFAADTEKLVADARRAFESGRFKEAAAKYLQAANSPDLPQERVADLSVQSAWASYIDGDAASAKTSLKKAFLARPQMNVLPEFYSEDFAQLAASVKAQLPPPPKVDLEALKASARERLAGGLAQDALYDLKNVSDSSDPEIHRLLAQAYEKLGKNEESAAEQKKAKSLEAGGISEAPIGALSPAPPASATPPGAENAASALALAKSAEDALTQNNFSAAADLAHKALEADPKNAGAHRILAQAFVSLNDPAGAEREFIAAVTLDASDVRSQIGLARLADKAGQPNTAAAYYRKALDLDGKSLVAASGLGEALNAAGDRSGARQAFGRATEIDPRNAGARDRYAVFLASENELAASIDQEIEAVKLDGGNASYHAHLGRAYMLSKMFRESEREFKEALRLDPKDSVSSNSLGTVLLARNDQEGAAEAFSTTLTSLPNDETAITGKAAALGGAQKWEQAAEVLRGAIADTKSAAVAHDLGVAEFNLGHFAEAVRAFERETELSRGSAASKVSVSRAISARDLEAAAIVLRGPAPAP
jgi:Tfp pilus assembly protein PilF